MTSVSGEEHLNPHGWDRVEVRLSGGVYKVVATKEQVLGTFGIGEQAAANELAKGLNRAIAVSASDEPGGAS
jgi:hypothetical protein